ncbi:Galactinol synthase 1 [Hondaea fermentalgiana]|uniref:Galactinol synthase 1 n=1 Tax=Hondaea fermentalgiana TaxID=2315210 RepID=A0A2R5GQU3_9STRA|nr:Galactinol synthase 1 [Hondaea fermentalgiana]|eukprot:GBG33220.1 Galactinol synthase 1 [Hondaea fermentalgiana]
MASSGVKENDGAAAKRARLWRLAAAALLGLTLLSLATAWTELPPPPQQQQQQQRLGAGGPAAAARTALAGPGLALDASLRGVAASDDFNRLKIAFAVTITKDGKYLDGAAVLKHSVDMLGSAHDVSFVAIVHPSVTTTRPALRELGIEILEYPEPITSAEIQGKHLRETIDKSGCCGVLELLKLRAFQLTAYDRVVLLDMDTLIVQSLDHLFDFPEEMLFTYDHAMDSGHSAAPPVQGGFMVLRPSVKTFERLVDIVREGDFRPGSGWAGQNIGWCWGGQTIQGLISYYYNRVDPDNKRVLDYCRYNAMVSTKNCEETPISEVISIHFTVCQKPWECRKLEKPLCNEMHAEWWKVRRNFEQAHGLPVSPPCKRRSDYRPLF